MLDLSKKVKKYRLKWFDGQELHLDMPSQDMLLKVMSLEDLDEEAEQFALLIELLSDILNHNTENRVFSEEEIKAIPLDIITLILTDYVNSVNERLGE